MLTEVHPGLWIGDHAHCSWSTGRWAAICHACKDPCHREAAGYPRGNLPADHLNYLWVEAGPHLVLNLIDPPLPLFKVESFTKALDWLDKWSGSGAVLIHCSQGFSRAPSIALLWLAKRAQVLDGESFPSAREGFVPLFPDYAPGRGITTFLTECWSEIA